MFRGKDSLRSLRLQEQGLGCNLFQLRLLSSRQSARDIVFPAFQQRIGTQYANDCVFSAGRYVCSRGAFGLDNRDKKQEGIAQMVAHNCIVRPVRSFRTARVLRQTASNIFYPVPLRDNVPVTDCKKKCDRNSIFREGFRRA